MKRFIAFDKRKAHLNILPNDWVDNCEEHLCEFDPREIALFKLSNGVKAHGCAVDWDEGDLPDNRCGDSFGLPRKKLPPKKRNVNWFPNVVNDGMKYPITWGSDEPDYKQGRYGDEVSFDELFEDQEYWS